MAVKKKGKKPMQGKKPGKPQFKRAMAEESEDRAEDVGNEAADDRTEREEFQDLIAQQNKKKKKSGGFQSLGLDPDLFNGVMKKGYRQPTPIQRKVLGLHFLFVTIKLTFTIPVHPRPSRGSRRGGNGADGQRKDCRLPHSALPEVEGPHGQVWRARSHPFETLNS